MAEGHRPPEGSEEWWRRTLTDPAYHFEPFRPMFLKLPSPPHCKLCGAPFKGAGGAVMGAMGFRPWDKNPTICRVCISGLNKFTDAGAEIECTLLFADVRSSTAMAERTSATGFASVLRRFYSVGSDAVIAENGIVDKYVGDEVVALFIPAFARPSHSLAAIRSARRLLTATGHGSPSGAWVDLGIGVHTGVAFVGSVAVGGQVTDFTALGDTVNTAARLTSEAAAGEALISDDTLEHAGAVDPSLERRVLQLRGRDEPVIARAANVSTLADLIAAAAGSNVDSG
jgi:adenylate cyclase